MTTPGPKPKKVRETFRPTYEYTDEQTELLKRFDEWVRANRIKYPSIIQMKEFLELQKKEQEHEEENDDVRDWDGTGLVGRLWSRSRRNFRK